MRTTLLVPAISACLLLAACGKTPDTAPTPTPSAPTTTPSAAPSATPDAAEAPAAAEDAKPGTGQDFDSLDAKPASGFDIDAVRQRIEIANMTFGDRYRKDDASWYAGRYTKDACVMPANETTICGLDAIRGYFYYGGANRDIDISVKAIDVYGSADAVIEEGNYDIPNPKGGYFDRGKFIAIWKLDGEGWKVYREIWTSSMPASGKR